MDYMTVNDLKTLYNSGWDISSHTWDHSGDPKGLLNTTINQSITFEIYNSVAWLRQNGFNRSADFFAYPDGAYNAIIISEVKNASYIMAKYGSGDSLRQPNLYGDSPYNLTYTVKATDLTDNTSVANVLSKINDAIAQKSLLILTFHQIYTNESAVRKNISAYNLSDFAAIAKNLSEEQAAGNLMVTNFSSYYAMINAHPAGNGTSITVSPTSNTYYYYTVNDSVGTTAYSPTALITVSNGLVSNTTTTSTTTTIATTTVASQGGNGGNSGNNGGRSGGSSLPTLTQIGSCYLISNLTTPDSDRCSARTT